MANNTYIDANGVYRNKLGITDAALLKRTEYDLTAYRSREILEQNALGAARSFDLPRLQAIHGHLFQDVYEWAGKVRSVPSSKRMDNGMVSRFANPDDIAKDWQALGEKTTAFIKSKGLSFEQKRETLVEVFAEANRIHAFPEGNGRSLQVFMKELAREQGIELDFNKISRDEWNKASALSGAYGRLFERIHFIQSTKDMEPIKKAFAEIASPVHDREQAQQKSKQTFAQCPTKQDVKAYAEILKEKMSCPEKRDAVIEEINRRLGLQEKELSASRSQPSTEGKIQHTKDSGPEHDR